MVLIGGDILANTTIYDVAGAAKVSLATVSRVMNNPEKVAPKTRDKVLEVIKKLGYRPNAIAKGLASRKSTTIGVVISDITRAYIAQMLGGIIDIAEKYQYSIKIFATGLDVDLEDEMRTVVAEQVDGILFLNEELSKEEIELVVNKVKEAEIPTILTNVNFEGNPLPYVMIDYAKGAYEMTKKMIDKGRKNIYLFSTVRHYFTNDLKEQGYIKAMHEAGLTPQIFRTSGDVQVNTEHFRSFFENRSIDGAISVRDSIAVSFMNVAKRAGRKIPEDILVAGLQNTKYATLSMPTLTCLDSPVYDIGVCAMRLLTKYMKQETVEESHVILPYTIVERESL